MAQPYIGEIRIFAGTFAPAGWMFCEGQTLSISENDTLFTLIGTTYGGDGQRTFNLPDLRSRVPIHQGNSFQLAQTGGVEEVSLTLNQIPLHTHPFVAAGVNGDQISPSGNLPANSFNVTPYINDVAGTGLNASAIGPTGGSQPHTNIQPFLCLHFIISLFGIFPSQT
jgi:microcystin-dependent protein